MSKRVKLRCCAAGCGAAVVLGTFLVSAVAVLGRETDGQLDFLRTSGKAFAAVARSAIPTVVFIHVQKTVTTGQRYEYNDPHGFFGDEFLRRFFRDHGFGNGGRRRQYRQEGQGSGFLISEDGYILTNNHVVGDADKITVKLHDGREFEAVRVGSDPKSEVAVIKIDGTGLPALPLGDSSAIEIGEWCIAIGNPFGLAETLTVGVVSAKGRSNIGITDYENFIQTDAAINPGNSGGPLLNIDGEAIGVNTAIYSRSGGYMGIGFAIPINMAKKIKDQLIRTGKVTRGYLGVGIQPITAELAKAFRLPQTTGGVLVTRVTPNSAAEEAGVREGDIILALDGKPIEGLANFRNNIAMTTPGNKRVLTLFRDGRELALDVVIGTLEEPTAGGAASKELTDRLGVTVQDLDAELSARLGYRAGDGVVVAEVRDGSPAARAGIRPGYLISSVNQKRVKDTAAFLAALEESAESGTVLLLVKYGEVSQFLALQLDE